MGKVQLLYEGWHVGVVTTQGVTDGASKLSGHGHSMWAGLKCVEVVNTCGG